MEKVVCLSVKGQERETNKAAKVREDEKIILKKKKNSDCCSLFIAGK